MQLPGPDRDVSRVFSTKNIYREREAGTHVGYYIPPVQLEVQVLAVEHMEASREHTRNPREEVLLWTKRVEEQAVSGMVAARRGDHKGQQAVSRHSTHTTKARKTRRGHSLHGAHGLPELYEASQREREQKR